MWVLNVSLWKLQISFSDTTLKYVFLKVLYFIDDNETSMGNLK